MSANAPDMQLDSQSVSFVVSFASVVAVGVGAHWILIYFVRLRARAAAAAAEPARLAAQEALRAEAEARRVDQFAEDIEAYFERTARSCRAVRVAFAAPPIAVRPAPAPRWAETEAAAELDPLRSSPALAYAV